MNIEKEIIEIKERLTALEKAISRPADEVAEEVSKGIKRLVQPSCDTLPKENAKPKKQKRRVTKCDHLRK